MTPRSMSSMNTVPAQPLENSAVMTTTPGVMNSRYEPDADEKPGMWTTLRNSWPNRAWRHSGFLTARAVWTLLRQPAFAAITGAERRR